MIYCFEEITKSFPAASFLLKPDGAITYANPAALRMLDSVLDDIRGSNVADITLEPPEKLTRYLELCLRNKDPLPGKLTFTVKDKEPFECRCNGYSLRDEAAPRDVSIHLICTPKETASRKFLELNRELEKKNRAYHSLKMAQERFQTVLDNQDAVVYVADMETYEILFVNNLVRRTFGNIVGKKCWQTLQQGQEGPCEFCTNKYLLDKSGKPKGVHVWEFQNTVTGQWFELRDSAIQWTDGRIVRFEIGTDISERRRMEMEVKKTQSELEALLNAIPETALLCHTDGKVIVANETAAKRFNTTVEKFIGSDIFDLMPEEAARTRLAFAKEVVSSGQPLRFSDSRDGRYFDTTLYPVVNDKGVVDRLAVFSMDITERKQAETAVREQERKYRNLFSSIRDVIIIADNDRNIIDANQPALREQFGYELDDIIGKKTIMLYASEEGFKQTGREVFNAYKLPVGKLMAIDLRKKNGEVFPSELFALKLLDDNGEVIGNLGIIRDITGRKQAEEALHESRERLDLIIERMPTGCIMWDPEFRVALWNPRAEAIFGYTRDEAMGKHAYDLIVDIEVVPHVDDIWRRLLTGDSTAHSINENTTKGGGVITCEWYNTPLKDPDGTVIGVVSMVQDVTERIEAEDRIKRSLKEKEVLLSEIHHRVKNNMAIISSMLSLQARHSEDDSITELLKEMQSRIMSMALVHEKLYMSRDFTEIDVKGYVEALVHHINRLYFTPGLRVASFMDIGALTLDMDTLIPCGLIINELISNSYKHAFVGRDLGEIRIAMNSPEPDIVVLEISDNGKGLPEGFDIKSSSSFGFGIVSALLTQLHGQMEPVKAEGTKLRITFPLKVPHSGVVG